MKPYYERGGITIYCGDCLEVMPKLDQVFDAIIADLPYGTTACSWDTIIPFEPLWENYKRLIKDRGAVVLFGSEPFSSLLRVSNMGWYKYDWVWDKKTSTGGQHANRRPMKAHEMVMVFCESTSAYNPQMEIFSDDEKKKQRKHDVIRPPPKIGGGSNISRGWYEGKLKYPRSVIRITGITPVSKEKKDGLHPTQKPVALLQYLIRTYTNKNDLILDNTMGSGTTLLAAQNEGRQATGIELSEDYCKIAVERLRQPSFFSIPDKPKAAQPKQLELVT